MTLPQGWVASTIGSLTELVSRGRSPSYVEASGFPVVNQRSVRWSGLDERHLKFVDPITRQRWSPDLFLREGDILWNSTGTGTIGRAAFFRNLPRFEHVVADSHVTVVRASRALDAQYLFALIRSPQVQNAIEQMQNGSTNQVELSRSAILSTPVPLPPLVEQRRIVARLDALTAHIARARAELARSHMLVASLRSEVLAIADNGDRTGRVAGWLAAPIRNGLSVKGSDAPPGVRALRLNALRSDVVDLHAVRYLPISVERAQSFLLATDDILVSRGNGTLSLVGRASRVPSSPNVASTIFPDTAFRLRFDPAQIDVTWLLYVWNSPAVRQQIEARARTTAGIWKISQVDLNEVALPALSLTEQRAVASRISAILARAARLEAEADRAAKYLDRLEKSILAKAFRGELVPQDPADEPASALLNRIKAERASAPKPRRGRGSEIQVAVQ